MSVDGVERTAKVDRETGETRVQANLVLDGSGRADVRTGIGFMDHLWTAFARFAAVDLELRCRGDVHVDDHHTVEDCALAVGRALDEALDDRSGIARFGHGYAPLDEALARAVVDFSGRPFAHVDLGLTRERLGELSCENVGHVITSMARAGRMTVHAEVIRGENDHHRAEAAFKALGLAVAMGCARTGRSGVPSTKGVL